MSKAHSFIDKIEKNRKKSATILQFLGYSVEIENLDFPSQSHPIQEIKNETYYHNLMQLRPLFS